MHTQTARSKGYGFIEFEYPEVAAIAAKSMNGHMILSKVLECKVLEGTQHNPFEGKTSDEFKFINWKKIYQVKINQVSLFCLLAGLGLASVCLRIPTAPLT